MKDDFLEPVRHFYDQRCAEKGEVIESVGWGDRESQHLRFETLFRGIDWHGKTILDVGCGFGDLVTFLSERGEDFTYIGVDISKVLLSHARDKHKDMQHVAFYEGDIHAIDADVLNEIDISVLSGTLTCRVERNLAYAKSVLKKMVEVSSCAVAANFMSSYCDYQLPTNFHYSPEEIFAYARTLSKKVNLLHDYPLYEFTVQLFKA